MRPISVTTPDRLEIAATEWGNPAGREIVFIHGYSQCSLAFLRQFAGAELAAEFRMVGYDLRGHGASDKPTDKESYAEDRLWADELEAVIDAAGLQRPVVVAWSYGGRVVSDYVRFHGTDRLAGINFVAALTKSGGDFLGPDLKHIAGTQSDDLQTCIAATRAFLRACFFRRPEADDFESMLAYNMTIPAKVRALVVDRTPNPGDMLTKMAIPTLVTHGAEDRLILPAFGKFTAASVPNAELSVYDGVGHSPFFEDAPRFNAELAAFVRAANAL